MKTMEERYRKDPVFARLVDELYRGIQAGQFTPSETREAAMLAQIKYEMHHPRPICISKDLMEQLEKGKFDVRDAHRFPPYEKD